MSDRSAQVVNLPQGVVCTVWRPMQKGALVGFCDLEIPAWNLALGDCKWFRTGDREWIGLPSSAFIKRDGTRTFKQVVAFTDKAASERFQQAALAAVRKKASNP